MRVTELDLSPAAFACLRTAGIADVDQLVMHSADELIRQGFGATELYEIVCRLNESGLSLPLAHGGRIRLPNDRDREMFRLRLIDGLTLDEIAARFGVTREWVRKTTRERFGLGGSVPAVKARRWAATERRRAGAEDE